MTDDPCAKLQSMQDWIEGSNSEEECRPCALGPVLQWYESELNEAGKPELAQLLQKFKEDDTLTPLEVAETMDRIKDEAPDLAERLKEFDCTAQVFSIKEQNNEEV